MRIENWRDREPTEKSSMFEDEIIQDDITQLNKTIDDEFLAKLCPNLGDNGVNDEKEENVNEEVHATFNPTLHWKQQNPILGMKFENPKQLKSMLCNYDVANGYQLCFSKNDSKSLDLI